MNLSATDELYRALVLRAEGRDGEAVEALQRALLLDPKLAEAHHQLGNLLRRQGRAGEALPHLEAAARLAPSNALILLNLGVTLLDLEQAEAAVEVVEQAMPLAGAMPEAHNLLACALLACGRTTPAREHLETALQLRPGYAAAHDNLGRVRRVQGRMEEALAEFQTALQSAPTPATHSNALLAANYVPGVDPRELVAFHRMWDELHARPLLPSVLPARESHAGRRLRVGYVSPDFRQHAVAFFVEPVFAAHDRTRFELFCYYNHARHDETTVRLRGLVEHWRDIPAWTDAAVAEQIKKDGIDILIDLAGHTSGNRLLVFARKPAPVQVTWLGYPNITGLAAIDYRVTDAACSPPPVDPEDSGSETLLRLPAVFCCYQPPADCPPVRTGEAGAADRPFTYCSFSNLAKLSSETVAVWSEILRQHPESRLLLKSPGAGDAETQAFFRAQFAGHGIAPERVEFNGEALPIRAHLQLYDGCDVALDPFPYNGTTTTCEALMMGVSVVSLAGSTHVARVGASFLACVGLPDLIAHTPEEYVQIALRLAQDPERRATLRATLRDRFMASPLGQAGAFTKDFEAALLAL